MKLDVTPVTYKQYSQFGYNTALQGAGPIPEATAVPPGSCWYCTRDIKALTFPSEYCSCGAFRKLRSTLDAQQNSRQDAALQRDRHPRLHEDNVLERHLPVPSPRIDGHHNGFSGHQRLTNIDAHPRTCGNGRDPPPVVTPTSSIPLSAVASRKEVFQLLSDAQRTRLTATDITIKCRILDRLRTCDLLVDKLRRAAAAVTAVSEGKSLPTSVGSDNTVAEKTPLTPSLGPSETIKNGPPDPASEIGPACIPNGIVVYRNTFRFTVITSPWFIPLLRLVFDRGKADVPGFLLSSKN